MVKQKAPLTKAAAPPGERERRLHPEPWKGRFKMPIEAIIDQLPPELRNRLERDAERAKHMAGGGHLQDWLDFEVGLWGVRREAMRVAHVNEPKGRGYNEAHGQLMRYYGLDQLNSTSVSAVLWLTDPQEKYRNGEGYLTRKEILEQVLKSMSSGQRSRLASPISARQRVEKRIAELSSEQPAPACAGADGGEKPVGKLKQTEQALAAALQKIHHLEEQAKRAGGDERFDLNRDTADDIAETILRVVGLPRSKGIHGALGKKIKAASRPAG
jgi:hypothetical protein